MAVHTQTTAAQYEQNQSRNPINAWLHSLRYKHIVDVVSAIDLGRPAKVIDIGCAQAKLFGILNRFPVEYTGIEIDPVLTDIAIQRFGSHKNFKAIAGTADAILPGMKADIVIALETMEHIPEGIALRIVEMIADMRPKRFVCSVPVEIGPAIWIKNVGSAITGYSRHHEYTWADTFWAGLYQFNKLSQPHTKAHIGFDWRWLAQTIRHHMKIIDFKTFPLGLGGAFSTSVFIVAEPY